jgi:hypothetical protein
MSLRLFQFIEIKSFPYSTPWVEKQGSVGVPLPASDQKFGFKLLSGVRTRPPISREESSSNAQQGFCGTSSGG